MGAAQLVVDFVGEVHELGQGGSLTFGRQADLVVDDANPYLHRQVGRLFEHNGSWWLQNLGSHVALVLVTGDGATVHLPPAAGPHPPATIVPPGPFTLGFHAGASTYELTGTAHADLPAAPETRREVAGAATSRFGHIELTDEEHLLLRALAAPLLADPAAGPEQLRTNAELAHELGWSLRKFGRKLDYLCTRLTRAGVPGLQGGRGSEAVNRRWRLVQHATAAGLVTADG